MGCGSSSIPPPSPSKKTVKNEARKTEEKGVQNIPMLKNGYYIYKYGDPNNIILMKDMHFEMYSIYVLEHNSLAKNFSGDISFGCFGKINQEVFKCMKFNGITTNEDGYFESNLKFSSNYPEPNGPVNDFFGILLDEKIFFEHPKYKGVLTLEWIEEGELRQKYINERQAWYKLECPYELNPGKEGILVWIQGPPGSGKSTVAQLLAKENGFVYYEGDAAMELLNPFVDPKDPGNPTIAAYEQKPTRDIPIEVITEKLKGENFELKTADDFFEHDFGLNPIAMKFMAKDIQYQKSRNFVVASSITTLTQKDCFKEYLPNCIFICLTMSKDLQETRLKKRHDHDDDDRAFVPILLEWTEKADKMPEEENTYFIEITEDKTPTDLKNEILDVLAKEVNFSL